MLDRLLGLSPSPLRRASLNDPTLNLNDPEQWDEVFGGERRAHTGETVSVRKALGLAPVWQAVSLISGDVAKLPVDLFRRRPDLGDGAREKADELPLARLVRRKANEEVTAVKFWRRYMVHALLWNRAYAYIQRAGGGEPLALYNLLPDRTQLERIDGALYCVTEVRRRTETGKYQPRLEPIPIEDVLHIEGLSIDGVDGCDLVDSAKHAWGLALGKQKFASKFFKNGGRVGGILEIPLAMQTPARDRLEEGFRRKYENSDEPFKTVILRDNAKFHAAQTSLRETQLVEATEQSVRDVARWFCLAPSKLGLADSVSYNSKAEDNQAYLDSTLSIWLGQIAAECDQKLLPPADQAAYYFEHNTGALLRMNALDQFRVFETGIRTRVLSPNECRAMINRAPYPGGERFENPHVARQPPADPSAKPTAEPKE